MRTIHLRHRLLTLATLAALSGAAFAQTPAPTAGKDAMKEPQVRALLTEKGYTNIDDLDFEDGQWEIRFRDGRESRRMCLRSGTELIQLQHSGPACSRFIVDDGAREVTVQYTCKGNGYGRTNIRRESATLVQIDSQGIAAGLPFAFTAEARRVGPCR